MAKITRKTMQIFGSTGPTGDFDQFGSLAANALVNTKDPAVIQALSAYLTGWTAAVFGDDSPVLEDMNAICYLYAYQLASIFQDGVPIWDSGTTYYTGSIVQDGNGVLWKSLQDANLNNAVTLTAFWQAVVPPSLNPQVSSVLAANAISNVTDVVVAGYTQANQMAWSPELGLFCCVAENGATGVVLTSSNGVAWTVTTITGGAANIYNSICWSPEKEIFCAVSNNGVVATSSNGTSWTAQTPTAANTWTGVCWSPDLSRFVAVSNSGTNRVMTSPDGTSWSPHSAATPSAWTSVTWSSQLQLFAAVANAGPLMTSSDGFTWTPGSPAATLQWVRVIWSPDLGLFAAIAENSLAASQLMTSRDGIVWTQQALPAGYFWEDLAWSSELGVFCAIGQGGMAYSSNGVNWNSLPLTNTLSSAVVWSPEKGLAAIAGSAKVSYTKYVQKFIAP